MGKEGVNPACCFPPFCDGLAHTPGPTASGVVYSLHPQALLQVSEPLEIAALPSFRPRGGRPLSELATSAPPPRLWPSPPAWWWFPAWPLGTPSPHWPSSLGPTGKLPDAVNFWLGEAAAVTARRCWEYKGWGGGTGARRGSSE